FAALAVDGGSVAKAATRARSTRSPSRLVVRTEQRISGANGNGCSTRGSQAQTWRWSAMIRRGPSEPPGGKQAGRAIRPRGHVRANERSQVMPETTLTAKGTVVTAESEFAADILIEGESIAAVGRVSAPEGAEVVDASGCYVLPGLIDNHTHLSMPFMGMMSADDYDTGTQAAAAGGGTGLGDFAIQRGPGT